jgi:hypothetical protein
MKKSREESKESLASLSSDNDAPTPPPHGVPLSQNDTSASSSWLGGGSIPPIEYNDLSRPPPLPYRPAIAPRKSSATGSVRGNSLTQTRSASTLSPGIAGEQKTRTPSPEKSGRMLRTLRPGRESRPSSAKLPNAMRSRPDASKAATQAWSVKATATSSRPALVASNPSTSSLTPSARSSVDKPAVERPNAYCPKPEAQQPPVQAPFCFRAGEGSASIPYAVPPPGSETDPEPVKTPAPERTAPTIPRKPVDLSRMANAQGTTTALPSYRKIQSPRQTLDLLLRLQQPIRTVATMVVSEVESCGIRRQGD